jgi:hypothetical protein
LYEKELKGWQKIIIPTSTFTGKTQNEVLWVNFQPIQQISLFEKE